MRAVAGYCASFYLFIYFLCLIPMCPTFLDPALAVQKEVTDIVVDEGLFRL